MARGDHIYVHRLGFTHHGIDLGDGTVVHYSGELFEKSDAVIRQTSYDNFARGASVQIRPYGVAEAPEVVVDRAMSRVGENRYNCIFNNCEHFATWCKTGHHRSEQVKDAAAVACGSVGGGAAVAAGLGTVSATGAVAGLSASGIMSGLATTGSIVGGGAAAGIAAVGAAPAAITTGAMFYVLKDDDCLPTEEREARQVGRAATVVGAVGGTAASVGMVAAAGTVSGLSAAGITSGLAAVGATVGGGMAAGVVLTAAAPAVAAAALGYGCYRLWSLGWGCA
jgi:hypothetical protein